MVPRSTSDQASSKTFVGVMRTRASHAEALAKPAFAGGGDADRPRRLVAADPVQRKAARRRPRPEGAADMEPPLAPVEPGPAIARPPAAGVEIHPEIATE